MKIEKEIGYADLTGHNRGNIWTKLAKEVMHIPQSEYCTCGHPVEEHKISLRPPRPCNKCLCINFEENKNE